MQVNTAVHKKMILKNTSPRRQKKLGHETLLLCEISSAYLKLVSKAGKQKLLSLIYPIIKINVTTQKYCMYHSVTEHFRGSLQTNE